MRMPLNIQPTKTVPAPAINVAREFFALAKEEGAAGFTNMKLMKLLYKAQSLSLYERGRPLFQEDVKAWEKGPVVPSVYHENKTRRIIPFTHENLGRPSTLSSDDRELIHSVWTRYKHMSGDELSDATHCEEAYTIARSRSGPFNRSPKIKNEDMMAEVEKEKALQYALFGAYLAGTTSTR